VCITQQKTCGRLIREGADLAARLKGRIYVIHVSRTDLNFLDNTSEGNALQYLFNVSNAVGAGLTVLKSNRFSDSVAQFARDHAITDVVLGSASREGTESGLIKELKDRLQGMTLHVIPPSDSITG